MVVGPKKDNQSMKQYFMDILKLYKTVGCLMFSVAQFGNDFGPSVEKTQHSQGRETIKM